MRAWYSFRTVLGRIHRGHLNHFSKEKRPLTFGVVRELALLGSAASWPFAAHAQQPAVPVVAVLGGGSRDAWEFAVSAFAQGLKEEGHSDGQNVQIDYHWAEGRYDRLQTMAVEFAQRRVAVIVTFSGIPTAEAAKAATNRDISHCVCSATQSRPAL